MGNESQVREGAVAEPQMHAPSPVYGPHDEKPLEVATERRLTHAGTVVLPDDVVGSVHENPVPVPMNLDRRGRPALITATLMDERFALTSSEVKVPSMFGPMGAPPKGASIGIVFKPDRPGVAVSVVQFNATWADGHTEQLEVQVIAKAKRMGHEPAPADMTEEAAPAPVQDTRPPTQAVFNQKMRELDRQLNSVASSQWQGVDDIQREADTYKAPTPAPSGWALLAELAVMLGTAGVAAVVGNFVAGKIVGLVTEDAAHAAASGAGHAAGQVAGHAAAHEVEHAVTKTVASDAGHAAAADAGHAVAQDAAAHGASHYVGEGLATAIEDGIKDSVKYKAPEGAEKEGPEVEAPDSKEPQIQFFASQKTALHEAGDAVAGLIDRITAPIGELATTDPGAAIKLVEAIQGGVLAGKAAGKKTQLAATATQWVSFVAQGRHGHESAAGREVTNLEPLRKPQRLYGDVVEVAATNGAGVLEIFVAVGEDLGVLVGGARLDGVARLVGDRLLTMNLRKAGVPIRIRTGYKDVITYDETGDIQSAGPRQYEPNTPAEGDTAGPTQNHRGAQRIVDAVFAKTLSQWGISHIGSDAQRK